MSWSRTYHAACGGPSTSVTRSCNSTISSAGVNRDGVATATSRNPGRRVQTVTTHQPIPPVHSLSHGTVIHRDLGQMGANSDCQERGRYCSSYCRTEHFTTDVRREPLSRLSSSPRIREECTYFCPAVSNVAGYRAFAPSLPHTVVRDSL